MKKTITGFLCLVFGISLSMAQQGQAGQTPQQTVTQTQPYQPVQATQPAPAQAQPAFPFQFGIKIAPNISWMKPTADEYSNDGSQLGFTFGLVGEYRFTDNYAIAFGFNSAGTGGKLLVTKDIDANNLAKNVSTTYKLRYFEIPVMLKMVTNDISGMQYYFQTGLSTNFLYRTKGEEEYDGVSQSVDLSDEVNFMKVSFLVGIGLQTKISGNTRFFGGFLFNNGFTDILKGSDSVTDANQQTKSFNTSAVNNFLEINAGILF